MYKERKSSLVDYFERFEFQGRENIEDEPPTGWPKNGLMSFQLSLLMKFYEVILATLLKRLISILRSQREVFIAF